jgi:hypothetical protein
MGMELGGASELGYPADEGLTPMLRSSQFLRNCWTQDRKDLNNLDKMISSFLHVSRFAQDSELLKSHVIDPLLAEAGPAPGSEQVLRQVLESVVVRHRYVRDIL